MRSGQQALCPDDGVLDCGACSFCVVQVLVVHLDALALSERVPCQGDETPPRETRQAALPCLMRFSAALVAERKEDRRVWRCSRLGKVEIRGDVESGAALEDDFLDAVIASIEAANRAWIKWRAIRQIA